MLFLELLKTSLQCDEVGEVQLSDADWMGIFELARVHQVIPMIYNALQKVHALSLLPVELAVNWKDKCMGFSISQLHRTMDFLKIYERLNQGGIEVLVVKGLVCRHLYPDEYYRCSWDEDIYIKSVDYEAADRILIECGLVHIEKRKTDSKYEIVYYSPESGLYIELHTSLFQPESNFFGRWNVLFEDAFETSYKVNIEGVTVHTLPMAQHLLLLILHGLKHFMSSGLGIRQICDIVMYCNKYGNELPWDQLWQDVNDCGYRVWFINIMDIGVRYLGLNKDNIQYPERLSLSEIHSQALLSDIMKAGIFGFATPGREKSGLVTMQTVLKNSRSSLIHCIFPCHEYMKGHYPYCSKYPSLLPLAWFHRLAVNLAKEKNPTRMIHRTRSVLDTGKDRMKLLEEYQIVEN